MRIEFSQPYILLLIPAGVLLLVFSMRFMYVKSRELRIKQVILRSLVFILCVLALSGMKVLKTDDRVATVFVIDASDSVKEYSKDINDFVTEAISEKKEKDYVGVVSFGKNANIENFLSNTAVFGGIKTSVDSSSTDLESAVKLALSLMPDGYAKRLVILSDGAENSGSLKSTATEVSLSSVDVKVVTLPNFNSPEVYVSDLQVPDKAGTDEYFNLTVEVTSNISTNAKISLYLGRTLTGQKEVSLVPGKNKYVFKDRQSNAGLKTYRVTIEPETDTLYVNNEYSAFTNISKKNPVLIIDGGYEEGAELEKLFTNLGIDNNRVSSQNAPTTLEELLNYSAVILANVNANSLPKEYREYNASEEGTKSSLLNSYVSDHGRGVIACGGRNAFALGNYKDTPIEDVLPVKMDIQGEKEIPSMAMVMVIDKSGSMSASDTVPSLSNLDVAKQAAAAAVQALRETDYVGVISFDDNYSTVYKLQKKESGADAIKAISSIVIEGGTSIRPAVEAAIKMLSSSSTAIKHIILLTDGQDTYNDYFSVIQKMNEEGITLSAVAMGQGCNLTLLNLLSEGTNGRLYNAVMGTDVVQIFANEVYLSQNSYIVEGDIVPVINNLSDPVISEVVANGAPSLNAYVATTAKQGTNVLLSSDQGDPILCYRQVGLGKTVVWASDVKGRWSGNFFGWSENALLWNNLISLVTKETESENTYAVIDQDGSTTTINYFTEDFSANTKIEAVITDTEGKTSELQLIPKAPGEYSTSLELTNTGVYAIALKQYEGSEVVSGLTTAAIRRYSLEYTFNRTEGLLEDYARLVGGKEITSPGEVFNNNISKVKAMTDFTLPLLIAATLLFVLDIAYRRFRFRIVPEGFYSGLVKSKSINKSPASKNTENSTEEETSKKEKPKKEQKKDKKKKEPEILDTSKLLKR